MSLKNKLRSLNEKTQREATAARERVEREEAEKMQAAEDFDSVGCDLLPEYILERTSASVDYGPSFHYRNTVPGDIIALLEKFPPVTLYRYRDAKRGYSYISVSPEAKPDYELIAENSDGVKMELSGGHNYGQTCRVSWHTNINGRVYSFYCDMAPASYVPRIQSRAVHAAGHVFLRYEGSDTPVFPLGDPGSDIQWSRYARGSDSALQNIVVYQGARSYIDACAAFCDKQEVDSRAAWAPFAAMRPRAATPEEVGAHSLVYAHEKLRAGTLEQSAAMRTPEFLTLEAAARKNWRGFALCNLSDEARKKDRGHFDHYAFTLWYLGECGMNPDKGYKYGSAWL